MKSSIAIVLPAFNPHKHWEKILVERYRELCASNPEHRFILYLVNDGSVSGIGDQETAYLRQQIAGFRYIHDSINHGKGHALRSAIAQTAEDFLIYTDIDMPFTVGSMSEIIKNLPEYDVVFGIKQNEYYEQLPLQRKIISRILQRFIRLLFPSLPVSDTQCGLKGMNAKGRLVFLQTRIGRYLFDLEFILYASKNKLKIKPIPVELREGIVFGNMKTSILLQESGNLWKILRSK